MQWTLYGSFLSFFSFLSVCPSVRLPNSPLGRIKQGITRSLSSSSSSSETLSFFCFQDGDQTITIQQQASKKTKTRSSSLSTARVKKKKKILSFTSKSSHEM
ncbi:MAG: hypothetical protein J3R72DRAFT_157811 [Linnemannia gamsii]|nr:MAG: hypothetical protein J3R72DRAFT_157811 [Linnemannia gamsii]